MDRQHLIKAALKLGLDGALIVFSVLLAFFLNGYNEERGKQARTRTALQNIVAELKSNQQDVERVLGYHRQVLQRLNEAAAQPLPPQASLFDVLARAAPEGLSPPALQTTAWETAQASGALQNLKYEQSYLLSQAYRLQATGVDSTWKAIRSSLDVQAFRPGVGVPDIRYLAFSFQELVAQEEYLVAYYASMLKKLPT